MTRNMRLCGLTLLAGLVGAGCYSGDDPVGADGDDEGSEGGDEDDQEESGDDEEDDESADGSTSGDESGSSGTTGEDDDDDSESESDSDTAPQTGDCVQGIPGTSQIPRINNAQYDRVIRDLFDVTDINGEAPSKVAPLADDFSGDMTLIAWNGYQLSAAAIAEFVMTGSAREQFITCDPSGADCLEETIRNFGRKAFRRPVTDEEVGSFMRLTTDVEPAGTAEEHAEAILFAFLTSPSFLLIPELSEEAPDGNNFKLSSHEVAARLSFFLWGSIPDETLNEAADDDALQTKDQILEQAERMLALKEKSGPMIAELHRHYAVAPAIHWGLRDHDSIPEFDPQTNTVMMNELDAFFQDVAFEGGSFPDLFLSNVAFVNNVTAPLYGLEASDYGAELTKVTLDEQERPGFLTRTAFLSSFAHNAETSPALRGAFISQHVVGAVVDPPPPGARDATVEGTFETEREYIEALTGQGDCASCHAAVINPPGFVLENYDALGRWQDVDPRGGDINSTATVLLPGGAKELSSAFELMTEIANNEGTAEKYLTEVVEYATGRAPNDNDQCTVDALGLKVAEGYSILEMLVDLTQTDSFAVRATK